MPKSTSGMLRPCHMAITIMVATMAGYCVRARMPPIGTNTLRWANLVRLMCQLFQKSWGLDFR